MRHVCEVRRLRQRATYSLASRGHAGATALKRWYEEGCEVQSELPKLSMYMGHVSIASTTYYLRFMPAVVALASDRFAAACGV
jgi:hypothetical protein